jgi:hypothetical protein
VNLIRNLAIWWAITIGVFVGLVAIIAIGKRCINRFSNYAVYRILLWQLRHTKLDGTNTNTYQKED